MTGSNPQSSGTEMPFRTIKLSIYIVLFAVVLMVFLPSVQNDFVDWDDYAFVSKNPHLSSISWESLRWMATTLYLGAWHPLTWLSHGVDLALWGANPSPHRLMNILIHCANALLFCLLCSRLQDVWVERNPSRRTLPPESRLVAAVCAAVLFGVHPLRVESVVWISERKDVLCAFFFLSSLLAYLAYARRSPSQAANRYYYGSLSLYALASLAKPMAMTFPLVLLITDYFPLYRLDKDRWRLCVREKVPFFLISAGCVAMNVAATWDASVPFSYVPPDMRIMNTFHSIVFYIRQSIVPINLLPLYQMDRGLDYFSWGFVLSSVVVLGISTICAWAAVRGARLWLAAWGYFLVTLAPASGLAMSFRHAMADRYTYLPTLALWLLVGLGLAYLWRMCSDVKWPRIARGALALCVLSVTAAYAAKTQEQTKIWRNTETLWTHMLNNADYVPDLAYFAMGKILEGKGELDEAIRYYEFAFSLAPDNHKFRGRLAAALAKKGSQERAVDLCRRLIEKEPNNPAAYLHMGRVYLELERYDEALGSFQKSLDVAPGYHYAAAMLVATHLKMNRPEMAREVYAKHQLKELRIAPDMDVELRWKAQ
jgi:cytochrome c-type biogenesis protein CcmH/NrfG